MDNIFDDLKNDVFDTVSGIVGYVATWTPSDGSAMQTATVLFNDPTEKEDEGGNAYKLVRPQIEYRNGLFVGLKEMTDNNAREEVVIMKNGAPINFWVKDIAKKWDGDTFCAYMEYKNS